MVLCWVALGATSCGGGGQSGSTSTGAGAQGTTSTMSGGPGTGGSASHATTGSTGGHGGAVGHGGNGGSGGMTTCDVTKCPPPSSQCVNAVCDSSGKCAEQPKPDGTPAPTQVTGDCKQAVCMGGAVTQQNDDTDVPVDGNPCTDDVCTAGVPSNPATAKDSPCGPGGTSFCDGSGSCAQCTSPTQCSGTDTECASRTCNGGTCGMSFEPVGTPVAEGTMGDCQKSQCDGSGNVQVVADPTDVPDDGNPCTDDSCNRTMPVHTPTASGTSCGTSLVCDGAGNCVGCAADTDCPASTNPCLAAVCNAGTCGTKNQADGTACDDGDACTQSDTCQAGACTGASPVVCTAQDQCHDAGTCDPKSGACSNPSKADGTACDDGNACTQSDTCQAGTCTGSNPIQCAAPDACHTAGTCNPLNGVCSYPNAANGTACNDGNACTQTDTCKAGVCTGGNPVVCAAMDQCHAAGTCDPATGVCSNADAADGSACNDGNACTQTDTCKAGVCTGANPVVCMALDQCHAAGTCDPASGTCSNPSKADGTACNDGSACTQTDTCKAGVCTGGNPVVCPMPDQCHTAGTCDTTTGMCSTPDKADGTACNDGNACTQNDACKAGVCSGAPLVCTAQNGTNSCVNGACVPVCTAGFGDCDGNPANGCEANLETDKNNCGACGTTCGTTNATSSCSAGKCTETCSAGFNNCDGLAGNGCECTGTCCGTSCQTQHDNGFGGFYYDCIADGPPYTEQMALDACTALTGKASECPMGACTSPANTDVIYTNVPGQTTCTIWVYSGSLAGYAVKETSGICTCPTTKTNAWN